MKRLLLIFISFALVCCSTDVEREINGVSKGERDSIQSQIVNADYSGAPLGKIDLEFVDELSSEEYQISKTLIESKYSEETDTLIWFKRGNSVVRLYKSKEKIWMDSLDVVDKNFLKFRGGIDIGMPKIDFLKYFNINNEEFGDSISVNNEENNDVYFFFKNKKLMRILILPW